MANTMHGPYVKGATTASGPYASGGAYTSGNANNGETQSGVALNSFNGDLLSAFVLSGVTCAKDGTTATQLNVASGVAYLTQSDGTRARCDVGAINFSTTGHASATLYLDLNPDGSWSWATTHSAVTNHLTICSVTTDASANIATVTDARVTTATLLPGGTGSVATPSVLIDSEGGNTIIRSQPTANPLLIQVNGNNTSFNADGSVSVTGAVSAGSVSASGNVYGNIGGGPLLASGTLGTLATSATKAASVTIPVAGVYLFWVYLNVTPTAGAFGASATLYGYKNGANSIGQGNAAVSEPNAASGNVASLNCSWCYKVTCAVNDTLELWYSAGNSGSGGNYSLIAQYLRN